ncbi:MAG TPA: alpha-L-fucosidase, partial [Verrucomicrobiae bacterium]|nr:alpha-L-fucosidase [Verrucomicrobiae bacterium]
MLQDRRQFIAKTIFSGIGIAVGFSRSEALYARESVLSPGSKWYEHAWRRAVIDMHIPDWDPKFLSEFDPDEYVDALVRSCAQSIVCYAQSHAGLFNYPTKVGKQHAGLRGRDIVAEMIEGCHKHGIAVVLYTSLIHDRWSFDTHPEWRMKSASGGDLRPNNRFGVVCPNSPYR